MQVKWTETEVWLPGWGAPLPALRPDADPFALPQDEAVREAPGKRTLRPRDPLLRVGVLSPGTLSATWRRPATSTRGWAPPAPAGRFHFCSVVSPFTWRGPGPQGHPPILRHSNRAPSEVPALGLQGTRS